MKKNLLSLLCTVALILGLAAVPAQAAGAVELSAQGWYETLCAQLTGVTDADVKSVSYTDENGVTLELAGEDFDYLVRDMKTGGVRIDIPGVKAGTYELAVVLKDGRRYVAVDLDVEAYDRSGFAHKVHQRDGSGNITGISDYTEGVGAYNDDGTLKDNAVVLYVTEESKDTVTLTQDGVTVTGIGNILNSKGQSDKDKSKLLLKVADANIPIVVRILGEVTNPAGTTTPWSKENGGSTDDGGHMCIMQYVGNITIEGIGPDATVNGWGFSFSADGTGRTALNNKRAGGAGENIEVRNLTFRNVPEDCIGINGAQDGTNFKDSAEHVWVHHNSFYGPKGLEDHSKDGDKDEGDGAVDFRNGEYMTLCYNYFEGYHKTSLVGGGDANLQYHITWHHNWWKGVNSRAPLARQADIHIYNNLYEGQTGYCMSLRANTYIFSEYNTFLNCKDPVKNETDKSGGGVCKSYNDAFTSCTGTNNATVVTDKSQTVESKNLYANFDTDSTLSYIPDGDYALQEDAAAAETVRAKAGVQKANLVAVGHSAAANGTLGGEDGLQWFYTNDGVVEISGEIPQGDAIMVAQYDEHGRFLKMKEVTGGKATLGTGAEQGKLFWLNSTQTPQCSANGWGGAQG